MTQFLHILYVAIQTWMVGKPGNEATFWHRMLNLLQEWCVCWGRWKCASWCLCCGGGDEEETSPALCHPHQGPYNLPKDPLQEVSYIDIQWLQQSVMLAGAEGTRQFQVWQSRVEIEDDSIMYFKCIASVWSTVMLNFLWGSNVRISDFLLF